MRVLVVCLCFVGVAADLELFELPAAILDSYDEWREQRASHIKYSKGYQFGWPIFECRLPAGLPATSVNDLTPEDIGVIAAMGDSLTMAHAATATSLVEIGDDDVGINFVTGVDKPLKNFATLANLFSYFNPSLRGGSRTKRKGFFDFNFAADGATAVDLPAQARDLVSRLRGNDDWKFVNILIGSNDLCLVCHNETLYGASTYGKNLVESLKILTALQKVFVSVMPPFNISPLRRVSQGHVFCNSSLKVECPCISGMSWAGILKKQNEFKGELSRIVTEFEDREDFAVVVSPAIDVDELPLLGIEPNLAFIAIDCMHFSNFAHDLVAKQVWKGLFQPVQAKTVTDFGTLQPQFWECTPLNCPYLRTKGNSDDCAKHLYRSPSSPVEGVRVSKRGASTNQLQLAAQEVSDSVSLFWLVLGIGFVVGCVALVVFGPRRRRDDTFDGEERHQLVARRDLFDPIF